VKLLFLESRIFANFFHSATLKKQMGHLAHLFAYCSDLVIQFCDVSDGARMGQYGRAGMGE
jgi:hypothetical protein